MDRLSNLPFKIEVIRKSDGYHGVVVSDTDRFVDPRSFKTDSAACLATRATTLAMWESMKL